MRTSSQGMTEQSGTWGFDWRNSKNSNEDIVTYPDVCHKHPAFILINVPQLFFFTIK